MSHCLLNNHESVVGVGDWGCALRAVTEHIVISQLETVFKRCVGLSCGCLFMG